ncbi:MAG: VOC family protein [Hyphomonadaceae bacterium]
MQVEQLGYLIFEVPHEIFAKMRSVFDDVIGAPTSETPTGDVRVRLDGRPFRIMLRPSTTYRLAAIGWEVADERTLDVLSERVRARGIATAPASADAAAEREARSLVSFTDPDGFPVELFVDNAFDQDADLASQFVCGRTTDGSFGLGHLVQASRDRFAALDFYKNVLGFGFSDRITWDAADLLFLHCNKRHHSVALAGEIFGLRSGQIDHFMIETRDKERVERAYARLSDLGFPVSQTLGQHTNDKMYSFYMLVPAGFRIEFGYGGSTVEDPATWEPTTYDAPSSWGHELVPPPA